MKNAATLDNNVTAGDQLPGMWFPKVNQGSLIQLQPEQLQSLATSLAFPVGCPVLHHDRDGYIESGEVVAVSLNALTRSFLYQLGQADDSTTATNNKAFIPEDELSVAFQTPVLFSIGNHNNIVTTSKESMIEGVVVGLTPPVKRGLGAQWYYTVQSLADQQRYNTSHVRYNPHRKNSTRNGTVGNEMSGCNGARPIANLSAPLGISTGSTSEGMVDVHEGWATMNNEASTSEPSRAFSIQIPTPTLDTSSLEDHQQVTSVSSNTSSSLSVQSSNCSTGYLSFRHGMPSLRGSSSNRPRGSKVVNINFRRDLFAAFQDHRITVQKIRSKASSLPPFACGRRRMCLPYHLWGVCHSVCRFKDDHQIHSEHESNDLYQWCVDENLFPCSSNKRPVDRSTDYFSEVKSPRLGTRFDSGTSSRERGL